MNIYQALHHSLQSTVNVRRKNWEVGVYLQTMRKDWLKDYVDAEVITWDDLMADDWELNPLGVKKMVIGTVHGAKLGKLGFILHQEWDQIWKVGFNLKNTKGYIDHNRSEWSEKRLLALEDIVGFLAQNEAAYSGECNSFTYEVRDKDKCRELLLAIGLQEQEPGFVD